jgi:Protein of unknown function (DUF1648)
MTLPCLAESNSEELINFVIKNPLIALLSVQLCANSIMTEDLSNLHKILKDPTRVKILQILENSSPLSCAELLSQSGITNTGRLNYHLKILGDLIFKDTGTGEYSLSERGRLAVEFLQKLQAASNGQENGLARLRIPKTPLDTNARAMQALLCVEIILVLSLNLFAYFTLPAVIPLHYQFDGQVLSSGPKYIFLLFAVLFNIPQVVFLLLSVARNNIAASPLSAVNFPSFHSRLPKVNYGRRGYWVNKYFSPILAFGSVVGLALIVLNSGIYESTISSTFLPASYIYGTIAVIAAGVIGLLIYMVGYATKLESDSG